MPRKIIPPLYSLWASMLSRCRNERHASFALYGGRGIRVCDRWLKFDNFVQDVGERPSSKHTIDRIDTNGDYEPKNVRWATQKEQCRNMRKTLRVRINGVEYVAAEIADIAGVKTDTVVRRAAMGQSLTDILAMTPIKRTGRLGIPLPAGAVEKAIAVIKAKAAARTHCRHGHEFSPENTNITPRGHKYCRQCGREKAQRRRLGNRITERLPLASREARGSAPADDL